MGAAVQTEGQKRAEGWELGRALCMQGPGISGALSGSPAPSPRLPVVGPYAPHLAMRRGLIQAQACMGLATKRALQEGHQLEVRRLASRSGSTSTCWVCGLRRGETRRLAFLGVGGGVWLC